ncbi:MAG: JmjC domain-containing protein [Ostreibacterium sp.]
MKLTFSPFSVEQFLSEYWQQKPVIIRGGFKSENGEFRNPIEANELAGLATESTIESRLISYRDNTWQAESGPFTHYDQYGKENWSLIVQSVNHWLPAMQDFARLFDFIPQWRFDDIMVSFATTGGGVGAHVDNYDVFICQGTGQRRWRVGSYETFEEIITNEKLLHVKPFDASIDEVLSAGDILYIPPGYPHEGVSLNPSMSFSVGYKATNTTELLSGFADYLIDFNQSPALLCDKSRQTSHYGQINDNDFNRLQKFLQNTLSDRKILSDFLGRYYSQSTHELDLATNEDKFDEWLERFSNAPLTKLYGVKTLYLEENIADGIFYVDGEHQQLSDIPPEVIRSLCDKAQLNIDDITKHPHAKTVLHWLWQNTHQGYWYFS